MSSQQNHPNMKIATDGMCRWLPVLLRVSGSNVYKLLARPPVRRGKVIENQDGCNEEVKVPQCHAEL